MWTAAQTARFLAAIDDPLHACYQLMAVTGLRRGEAAALRWADIDLAAGVLTVSRQLQHDGRQLIALPPKSLASNRVLALDPGSSESLPATGAAARPGHRAATSCPASRWPHNPGREPPQAT